ncbi:MAG: cytochrome c3 family protein [Chloroflexota bacterium]
MRRLALVLAGGALWLILAAVPALADGGPHVQTVNNGSLGINADGCAGCHRAHTAQGPFLINAADETALCQTCHGAAVTGSTVDVMTGVQYALAGRSGGTQLGALRGGGYDQARIDAGNASRLSYYRNADLDVSQRPKVGVGAAEDVTSAHIAMTDNGLTSQGIAWGNGAAGSGVGPAVEISCASCHNPHGNGQYRILNKIPEATGAGFDDTWVVDIIATYASTERIYTEVSHGLQVGDVVTIAGTGSGADGAGRIVATVSSTYFTLTGVDIVADTGPSGTVERTSGVVVTDATLPAPGDTRNYTVMQVKGGEGVEATYLLYASQVAAAATANEFPAMPAVSITSIATTDTITTGTAHGLSVGDLVTIAGSDSTPNIDGVQTVSNVGSSTTFKLAGATAGSTLDITGAGTTGTVSRNAIAGDYTATGGDYFARNVPWNPSINDATCDPTVYPYDAGCATANSAPNGRPSTFSGQITAWCASCHTRYFANNNPNPTTPDPIDTGAAWMYPRPGEDIYMYQHRTVAGRDCLTCHVSHGSNAAMTGSFSGSYEYPDGTASASSRLLKVDNRGTCQACHDPTGTIAAGTYIGPVGPTVP